MEKSPCWIYITSSTGCFSIVMLVFRGVDQGDDHDYRQDSWCFSLIFTWNWTCQRKHPTYWWSYVKMRPILHILPRVKFLFRLLDFIWMRLFFTNLKCQGLWGGSIPQSEATNLFRIHAGCGHNKIHQQPSLETRCVWSCDGAWHDAVR